MKTITLFANEKEANDFAEIRRRLERNSDADTVRAMISFCKKNLSPVIDITNAQPPSTPVDVR
ncbi:MAG: hypothetical protein IJY46_07610 [Lentisphaeria bacterium]|nr:hypothetical protein [Lentisphaeria bacterium]